MHMAQVLSVRDVATYPLYLIPQQWAHGRFPNTSGFRKEKKMVWIVLIDMWASMEMMGSALTF